MLDLKYIIKNLEDVKKKLSTRGFDISKIDSLEKLSFKRSEVMSKIQLLEAERNKMSKKIGEAKSNGEDINDILKEVNTIKKQIIDIKDSEVEVNNKIKEMLLFIPNIPNKNTPIGKNENENVDISEFKDLGRRKFLKVIPHYEIAAKLDIVDFERAVKLSGTRFWSYKGLGAKLLRALEFFMLEKHIEKGYIEIVPPLLVKSSALEGTGQLPKFADDLFKIENDDKWLIPTAEVPLTNFYSNEIIDLSKKPILLTAYTPCFRAEAGSGGKDMKGLIRAHQFNKVEIVKLVKKEDVEIEYKKTIQDAKDILIDLELPFREVKLCTGDIGFSSEETTDLEVWIPSEKKYREISSISSFGDFQGRRSSIRYKDNENNTQFVNTINGSGLAIDRTIAAILENYQNKDGTISIPEVLIKFMGVNKIK